MTDMFRGLQHLGGDIGAISPPPPIMFTAIIFMVAWWCHLVWILANAPRPSPPPLPIINLCATCSTLLVIIALLQMNIELSPFLPDQQDIHRWCRTLLSAVRNCRLSRDRGENNCWDKQCISSKKNLQLWCLQVLQAQGLSKENLTGTVYQLGEIILC